MEVEELVLEEVDVELDVVVGGCVVVEEELEEDVEEEVVVDEEVVVEDEVDVDDDVDVDVE